MHQSLVETLDLSNPSEWQNLTALPTAVYNAVFARDGDDLIIINSYYSNMLRFNVNNLTFSLIQGQALPLTGGNCEALAIDDRVLFGCPSPSTPPPVPSRAVYTPLIPQELLILSLVIGQCIAISSSMSA